MRQSTVDRGRARTPRSLLLFLLVPDAQHDEVLVLEVVDRDRLHVREHLAPVREPDLRRADDAARVLQDAVPQRGHEQVERQVGDRDDASVELPLGLRGLVRELDT